MGCCGGCRASRRADGLHLSVLRPGEQLCHTCVRRWSQRISTMALLPPGLRPPPPSPQPAARCGASCQATSPRCPRTPPPGWASSRRRRWLSTPLVVEEEEDVMNVQAAEIIGLYEAGLSLCLTTCYESQQPTCSLEGRRRSLNLWRV